MAGTMELWWYLGGVVEIDGHPEPRVGALLLKGGLAPEEVLAQIHARSELARLDHGPGVPVILDQMGEHYPPEMVTLMAADAPELVEAMAQPGYWTGPDLED